VEADFTIPEHKERRKAFRVAIAEYQILIHAKDKKYPFSGRDLSVSGICFAGRSKAFKPGVGLMLDIVKDGKTLIANLRASIIWAENGLVGCAFKSIDSHQEDGLCALTLAEQKRQAARRKSSNAEPAQSTCAGASVQTQKPGGASLDLNFDDPWSSKHKK